MNKLFQLKGFVAGLGMAGFAMGAQAQTAIDSTECKKNYSIFSEYYKQKNYEMAIGPWREQFKNCEDLYLGTYVYGIVLYKDLQRKAENEALKGAYQDTIVMIYDKYLSKIEANPKKFNQFWDYNTVTLNKATDMQSMNKDSYDQSYPLFQKIHKKGVTEFSPNALVFYMQAAYFKKVKNTLTCDSIADLYMSLTDIQELNFKASKDSSYLKAQANLDKLAESCLDCGLLVENFVKQYATMKNDTNWVKKAVNILDRKKCLSKDDISNNETIVAIYEANANMNSSSDAMMKIASLYLSKKQYGKAEDFMEKAVALETDNDKKADYLFILAQTNYTTKKSSTARENARKAAALRPNWGDPYIFIGDLYASEYNRADEDVCNKYAPLWAAADKYNYAKSIDASVANKANQQLGRVTSNYPDKQTMFFECTNIKEGDSVRAGGWIGESTTVRTR